MTAFPSTLAAGRYTVTDSIGAGGMASVHLCYDHRLRVWRAVKFLLPQYAKKRRVRERFETEAHAMARLEHKNVLRVYDSGIDNGQPFMVMELAPGGSILEWLELHGAMPPKLAVDVMYQVAQGVSAAHEEGIIHRDIKPDNVLLNRKGTCKVTDFGIAQLVDFSSFTRTGSVMGTIAYMAPEQKQDAKHVDPRVDVYALGATLFCLVKAEPPMDLFMAAHEPKMLDGIPESLHEVVLKSTSFSPDGRYDTAAEMAEALVRLRDTLPEPPPSTPSLVTRTPHPTHAPPPPPPTSADPPVEPVKEVVNERPSRPSLQPLPYYSDQGGEPVVGNARIKRESALRELAALQLKRTSTARPAPGRENDDSLPDIQDEMVVRTPTLDLQSPTRPTTEEVDTVLNEPAETEDTLEDDEVPDIRTSAQAPPRSILPNIRPSTGTLTYILGAAIPLTLLGLAIAYLVVGVVRVGNAATAVSAASDALFHTVEEERAVIDDLERLGGNAKLLEDLRSRVVASPGDVEKPAISYTTELHAQLARVSKGAPSHMSEVVEAATVRTTVLDASVVRYQDAMKVWYSTSSSGSGALACGLGLVTCP